MNDDNQTIPCDAVLLPSEELAQKAVHASQELQKLGSKFVLDNKNYYAHMSLYMFQLRLADIPKVQSSIEDVTSSIKPVKVTASKYELGTGYAEGYIDPEYIATDELHRIQKRIIETINPVRAGMRKKDVAKMNDAQGVKRDNFEKYGFGSVGDFFRPHMTLTRLHSNTDEVFKLLPDVAEFNGIFDRIGVFEMGDNGTCVNKLFEIKL